MERLFTSSHSGVINLKNGPVFGLPCRPRLVMSVNSCSWWVSIRQKHCRTTDRRHLRLRSTSSCTTPCSKPSGTGWYCYWRSTRPSWCRTTSRFTTRRATLRPFSSSTPLSTSSSSSTFSSTSTRRSSVPPEKSSPTRASFVSTTWRPGSSLTCCRAYLTTLSTLSNANISRFVAAQRPTHVLHVMNLVFSLLHIKWIFA